MNRKELFDYLEFNDYLILYQQVHAVSSIELQTLISCSQRQLFKTLIASQ